MNVALIIAAGIGVRAGYSIPKQFVKINKKPLIIYTLEAFSSNPNIDAIEIVCVKNWIHRLKRYIKNFNISKVNNIVVGGSTGYESIGNGLDDISKKFNSKEDIVVIHDAIRPLVDFDIINNNILVCKKHGNATTAIPCYSVMMYSKCQNKSNKEINRDYLKITQTPQSFYVHELLKIRKKFNESSVPAATCSLYAGCNKTIYFSKGSSMNIKITTKDDIEIFKAILKLRE